MKAAKKRCLSILARLALALLLVGCAAHAAVRFKSAPVFDDSLPIQGRLYTPEGEGPFPAIVILHGCGGVDDHHVHWAEQVVEWGYVALIVDSFGPRHVSRVCGDSFRVPPTERAADAYGAAVFLQQRPDVDGERIGLIGFSHGGWTGLQVIQRNFKHVARMEKMPFRAAVLFYPWCDSRHDQNIDIPTLILIGAKDDWTPAAHCVELMKWIVRPEIVELVVYADAYHDFDRPKGNRDYLGHTLKYDDDATQNAEQRTRNFFDRHLHP